MSVKAFKFSILFVMITLISGCSAFGSLSDALFMMTPQQELAFGAKARPQIESKLVMVQDPEINAYIGELGSRLWANSQKGPLPPRFHVVQDKELNAFAIPGGDVYVNTGTIMSADDEAELAGVIAHELGHVARRHGASQVSRQQGVDLVTQIALGDAAVAAQMVSGVVSSGVMFNYSREDEREADTIAINTLNRVGYDPLAMRDFFKKIKAKYGDTSKVMVLFASHPPTAERIQNVETTISQLPAKQRTRPTAELNKIKAKIK